MGRKNQHRFHGSSDRFEVVAEFVYDTFGSTISYIADVAGGQGMLTRILNKKYHYHSEVVDPRGWVLKGVPNRSEEFSSNIADYYDLVIGLHPDEATRSVAEAAIIRPTLLIPCCNFWSEEKLGRDELVDAIGSYYIAKDVPFKKITFNFKGPKNIGLISFPSESTLTILLNQP